MTPTIAIINASTVLQDADFQPVVDALQKQVSGDFADLWNRDAALVFVPKGQAPDPDAWPVIVSDTVTMAGALGYHDITAAGNPVGKVGAKTTMDDGGRWEVTLSHEVLEMLGDPDIVRTVFVQQSAWRSIIVAYEACDAVEEATYLIDGVPVSDFVTQEWFDLGRTGGQYSFLNTVQRPLQLAPGGYISVFYPRGGRWSQLTARKESYDQHQGDVVTLAARHESGLNDTHVEAYRKLPNTGSRRERRQRPRAEWIHTKG